MGKDFDKIDVRAGQMTYGQRIALGQLFESRPDEQKAFSGVFEILAPGYKVRGTACELEYFREVVEGIRNWITRETKELAVKPTPEEIAAGVAEMSRNCGYMSTLAALAERYSTDPDTILEWKYGKVFNLLYVHREQALFARRFQQVMSQKSRVKK